MSLDTLVATIAEVVQEEDAEAVETSSTPAPIEMTLPVSKVAKKKGRPSLHTKTGRVYFLKSEIEEIRKNPATFIEWMKDTYAVSDARYTELTNNKVNIEPEELCYTLHGEILEVLNRAEEICKMHPGRDITFDISKQKLVAPTHVAYVKPTTEKVSINGKSYDSTTFQEFSPSVIYVYLTIR
jgi:hypothetical protein